APGRARPPGRRAHRGRGPRAPRCRVKKKRSSVAVLRCVEAVALSAFYGRPACQLLDREVLAWGLVAGHLTPGAKDGQPPPNGRRRAADARTSTPTRQRARRTMSTPKAEIQITAESRTLGAKLREARAQLGKFGGEIKREVFGKAIFDGSKASAHTVSQLGAS